MGDLQIFGIDDTTGQHRPLDPGDTIVDSAGNPAAGSTGLSTRYVEGLICEYATTSTATIKPGSCRNKDDDDDITLTSEVTVDITSGNAANGLDEKTLTGTVTTTTSSTSVTGSSTSFLTEFGVRATTGTTSTTGTAATGISTEFLSEYSVGDLLGNAASGYSRVTAIASDTGITLSAAIPGGDLSSASVNVIENATLEASNGEVRRVDTITSDTALALTATITTGSAGTALAGSELADTWYSIWVVKGSSGVAGLLSTQRTALLSPPTGYTDSSRRIGWSRNNQIGDFWHFIQLDDGPIRHTFFAASLSNLRVLSGGTATSFTEVLCSDDVPPTASSIMLRPDINVPGATTTASFRKRNFGTSATNTLSYRVETSGVGNIIARCPCDGAQYIDYLVTNNAVTIDIVGYFDTL